MGILLILILRLPPSLLLPKAVQKGVSRLLTFTAILETSKVIAMGIETANHAPVTKQFNPEMIQTWSYLNRCPRDFNRFHLQGGKRILAEETGVTPLTGTGRGVGVNR